MNAIEHRQAIIDGITEALPGLVEVAAHGGRFTLNEVRAIAQKSPAARVACHAVSDVELGSSGLEAVLVWSCTIITTDKPGLIRDDQAFALAASLIKPIAEQSWGAAIRAAERVRGANLYSRQLSDIGVAMWNISWSQLAELNAIDPGDLDDLLRVSVEYDLAPIDGNIDARDQIDLDGGSYEEDQGVIVDDQGDIVVDAETAENLNLPDPDTETIVDHNDDIPVDHLDNPSGI
jgi:hypothetical protein